MSVLTSELGEPLVTEVDEGYILLEENLDNPGGIPPIWSTPCSGRSDFSEVGTNKPRFTADPVQAPPEVPPEVRAWLQEQMQRIDDYWPKDLEQRLAELERLYPYIGGTWTIVDYSSCNLGIEGIWEEYQAFEYRIGLVSSGGSQVLAVGECWSDLNPTGNSGFSTSEGFTATMVLDEEPEYMIITGSFATSGSGFIYSATGAAPWSEVKASSHGMNSSFVLQNVWKADDGYWYVAGTRPAAGYTEGLRIARSTTIAGPYTEIFNSTSIKVQQQPHATDSDRKGNVIAVHYDSTFADTYVARSFDYGFTWAIDSTAIALNSNQRGNYAYCPHNQGEHDGNFFILGQRSYIWGQNTANFVASVVPGLTYAEGSGSNSTTAIGIAWKGSAGGTRYSCGQNGGTTDFLFAYDPLAGWGLSTTGVQGQLYSSIKWDETCAKWAAATGTAFYTSTDPNPAVAGWSALPGSWNSMVSPYSWRKNATP